LGDATNEDIAEVMLRHAFAFVQDSPARNTHYGSYCIAVFGKDPEPLFLRRFVDAKPLVRPLSDCRDTDTGRRRDPEKKPAAIFEVHAIRSTGLDMAEGDLDWSAGYWPSAQGYVIGVRRLGGSWSITKARLTSVE
jgi:hypothetical protein